MERTVFISNAVLLVLPSDHAATLARVQQRNDVLTWLRSNWLPTAQSQSHLVGSGEPQRQGLIAIDGRYNCGVM